MQNRLQVIAKKTIEHSFCLLFFLVPLFFTPVNYELFEYNKMMLVYFFTSIITGAWVIRMFLEKKIRFSPTPLLIPLALFLTSQIISTVFSLDRHVSLFGYYSRFNGGLLSTISYLLLYFAFAANFPKEKIGRLIFFILSSGFLVAGYGILEHFGIDKNIWVQDVQNRVFSTLGQPNWLAAYLAILIPLTIGVSLNYFTNCLVNSQEKAQSVKLKAKSHNSKLKTNWKLDNLYLLGYWIISCIFYTTLIFTKSRSGFLGFWTVNLILWSIFLLPQMLQMLTIVNICGKRPKQFSSSFKNLTSAFLIINLSLFILTFLFGTPFDKINRFSFPELSKYKLSKESSQEKTDKPLGTSVIEVGITESSVIRKIVWKGAYDIFRHYPVFGSGVETFAFSYYKFRPVEHNMTSEWDFLYNKAHNEYINYAATTGGFGLGSYLLVIGSFVLWILNRIRYHVLNIMYKKEKNILDAKSVMLYSSLFCSWLSILITNFFGFSVVIIQLFFFLIPAICFVLNDHITPHYILKPKLKIFNNKAMKQSSNEAINNYQLTIVLIILFSIFYFLFFIIKVWYADVLFAKGFHASRAQEFSVAYEKIKEAILLNDKEPLYYDELSYPASALAVSLSEQKEATLSALLTDQAVLSSQMAITLSPNNVNYWKTRTRVFYALSSLDEKYLLLALKALEKGKELSPTDPKIRYNLGVLLSNTGKENEAVKELEYVIRIKPDYRDAYLTLSYLYSETGQKQKAREPLEFILDKIATDDGQAKKRLEEL